MRKQINLNGRWCFTHLLDQRPENNVSMMEGNVPLYASGELNRSDWVRVDVPGVWEKYAPKYEIFEGVCWYYRSFTVADITPETFALLRFSGVIYRADIYVNGRFAGAHESGYVEFVKNITGMLQSGVNHLAVRVDNRPHIVKWPHDWGYMNFGGIHGNVTLELSEHAYFEALSLTPDWDCNSQKGILGVKGVLCRGAGLSVTVRVADRCFEIQPDANGAFDEQLTVEGVCPWHPENTVLYPVTVGTAQGEWCVKQVGFRHIEAKERKIKLNGTDFRLNGCCYLCDSPKYGLTAAEEQLRADLNEMKAAGVNAIRTHYPMDEIFYRLCDEMGFVSWIELPVYCSHPDSTMKNTVFSRPELIENAKMILDEMIALARSHPSVVIYSIGNECNVDHPEAVPFFKEMADTVRRNDPTRLVGYAALYGLVGNMGELVDVLGINCYDGWYSRICDLYKYRPLPVTDGKVSAESVGVAGFRELAEEVCAKVPADLPLLLTEFGGDSKPGYRSSALDMWSEDYHAALVKEFIEAARSIPAFNGTFVFAFIDYLDPSKPQNGFWNEYNLKGMLSFNRERKQPFYALREAYKN